uniref:DUF4757 domain-containing protein n=1 Tax=Ciona savignyi TaxID=51511 RepID=H2Z6I5_CIOSA
MLNYMLLGWEDSDHSRCSDDEHREVKPRECDDMLQRRLAGNMPAALRKKKIESSYKQYITPSGNPMEYVKKHMRSKSMSDMEVDPAKREEQMERSARYDELQKLKEQLKEEEESWSSNLQNWKSRRRSATFDVRKRKEDREVVQLEADNKSRRKTKTFKEIIEAKKQRDSELFDDIDVAGEPGIHTAQKQTPQISSSFDGMRNGGVVNVTKDVYKDTSKDDYTSTSKDSYTGTNKDGYTGTSKNGYTATSKDGYTGTSKYSFTGPKKDGYTSISKDGYVG